MHVNVSTSASAGSARERRGGADLRDADYEESTQPSARELCCTEPLAIDCGNGTQVGHVGEEAEDVSKDFHREVADVKALRLFRRLSVVRRVHDRR